MILFMMLSVDGLQPPFICNANRRKYNVRCISKAINDINKAVEMTPEDVAMWVEKGSVHLRVGQHNEAIEALEKAISLDPKAAAAYRMLGYCQIQLKKTRACATCQSKRTGR